MLGFAAQDLFLLVHCCVFVFVLCIKDDLIYSEKTQKALNRLAWIIGVPCIISVVIMSVYLAQRNY